jgi:Zinc knuckle
MRKEELKLKRKNNRTNKLRNKRKQKQIGCFYCRESGHRKQDCKKIKDLLKRTTKQMVSFDNNENDKKNMILYIFFFEKQKKQSHGWINIWLIQNQGKIIRALIDMGSEVDCLLSKNWSLETQETKNSLENFDGKKVENTSGAFL